MHYFLILLTIIAFLSCSPTRNTPLPRTVVTENGTEKDSIIYVETEIEARQKNYLDQLKGSWNIVTMKRQAMIPAESLTNTFLMLNTDGTFTGKGGCNNISGKFMLKGTGIKFRNIISTKMYCNNMEQETTFLKLLTETVSAYTVTNDSLHLRDGSANIIFRAGRK